MSSVYPGSLDDNTTLPQPGPNTVTNAGSVTHAILHDNEIQAIQALETKLGTGSSTATANTVLRGTGSGTTAFGQVAVGTDISGLGTGVATFLATPTSANLAATVTNETGSGALVFGTSPNITTPTGIVKGDVGLGNVDNTSDTTKNSATATLTNKSIDGGSNTLTNIPVSALSSSSGAFSTWTPTWTGLTIGNATVVARYTQVGKHVEFHIVITVGSTTSLPVGVDTIFSLPVTATSSGYLQYVSVFGRGGGLHGGTLQFNSTLYNNTTTAIIAAEKVVSATAVSAAWNTTNVGITTGDTWGVTGIYEAA